MAPNPGYTPPEVEWYESRNRAQPEGAGVSVGGGQARSSVFNPSQVYGKTCVRPALSLIFSATNDL